MVLPEWSRAEVASGGRAVLVDRAQAGHLDVLIARLLFSASETAQDAAPTSLRIALTQGARPVGVLEAVEGGWRWTPAGDAAPPRLLRPGAELSDALRQEAERLLAR
jgi:hypothetical protein